LVEVKCDLATQFGIELIASRDGPDPVTRDPEQLGEGHRNRAIGDRVIGDWAIGDRVIV
jgi:hypothetical protein